MQFSMPIGLMAAAVCLAVAVFIDLLLRVLSLLRAIQQRSKRRSPGGE